MASEESCVEGDDRVDGEADQEIILAVSVPCHLSVYEP